MDAIDNDGNTALICAAEQGHVGVVGRVVCGGGDVNAINKFGLSAAVVAALLGHAEVVWMLMEHGADLF